MQTATKAFLHDAFMYLKFFLLLYIRKKQTNSDQMIRPFVFIR